MAAVFEVEKEIPDDTSRREQEMKPFATFFVLAAVLLSVACSHRDNVAYKDDVKKALEQAELKDVTVTEDKDKNTITLAGTVHSDGAKAKAADVAKEAANTRIIANEISVQPVGSESEAKDVASNLDEAIEKNYKAALISSGLDKQHIRFKAKNGVVSLTGSVKNANERRQADRLAARIPNVQQVLNQIEVRR
jgi:hyperosmotically inducible periplasmic protein